jgi:DNA-3-methyladenine glycosylase
MTRLLSREFYARGPLVVAKELIGKKLVRTLTSGDELSGLIVESEAYGGESDPASHAYRGRTARNGVMFGKPGHAYVYFTYGVHYCLNFVTHSSSERASAVLIRAAEPLSGLEIMSINRKTNVPTQLASGPGKLCQAFSIDGQLSGVDVTKIDSPIKVEESFFKPRVMRSKRIGISVARDRMWRFYADSNPNVSKIPRMSNRSLREG